MDTRTLVPQVTDQTLADTIAPGSGLVAVKFWAPWCGPCRMMKPTVEAVARDYAGSLRVVEFDTDANPRATAQLGVRSIPMIILFRDGEPVDQIIGAVSATTLRERVDRQLATS